MGHIQSRHATPWHRKSWDHFLKTSFPELVGAHCRLTRYHVQPDGMTCAITLGVEGPKQPVTARYELIEDGLHIEAVGVFNFREFGIKPYSAMLGAVKNKDEFHVYVALVAVPVDE